MDFQLKNGSGAVAVSDAVFAAPYNESLVHQVVVAFLAGARSGTKAQKTRSEVSGGGVKPWKQKGSGRARAGTIRSPLWRGGGVTFAAKPRNYAQKVNRKMYRAAICSIVSELARQERFFVVDAFELAEMKTKACVSMLEKLAIGQDLLLITQTQEPSLYLAARNLPNVTVVDVSGLNPALLLRHKAVVADKAAVEKMNEWLK